MVLVIVINWKGARHTNTCLESLAGQQGARFDLVVCDNASNDDSVCEIRSQLGARWGWRETPAEATLAPVADEVRSVTALAPTQEGAGGAPPAWDRLWLWTLTRNLGYAGGANAVLRWGLRAGYKGFWILNNDLALAPDALAQVCLAAAVDDSLGPIGSVLMHWEEPGRVQAVAGRYHHLIATGTHQTALPLGSDPVLTPVDYPVGACLYASRRLLERVGPMDERYFLYYEEIDWAERARRAGFRPAVALRSRARHREGASTGSPQGVRNKSPLSEHFGAVNRLRVTRRFWPWLWPLVWASLGLVVAERLLHGEWARAGVVLRVMAGRRAPPPAMARKIGW